MPIAKSDGFSGAERYSNEYNGMVDWGTETSRESEEVGTREAGRRRSGIRSGTDPYFTSTVAPSASSLAFNCAASSFETFSFTLFGAPSTKSLASFKPRPVISRTTLMT